MFASAMAARNTYWRRADFPALLVPTSVLYPVGTVKLKRIGNGPNELSNAGTDQGKIPATLTSQWAATARPHAINLAPLL
jgi:hypothetical protein